MNKKALTMKAIVIILVTLFAIFALIMIALNVLKPVQ
jgi:hypothetical protein